MTRSQRFLTMAHVTDRGLIKPKKGMNSEKINSNKDGAIM